MPDLHASTLCRRELALLEATVLHWYRDATGTWTCCTGHTAAAGPPAYLVGQSFTAVQSDAILAADLGKVYEPAVARRVTVPLTQYEFDAIVLLTYNIGEGNLAKSSLLACLNRGDKAGAAEGFGHFTTSHGQQLAGLVKRRGIERQIFTSGIYPGVKPAPGHSTAEMAAAVTLGEGMTGDAVTRLQTDLKTLGFLPQKPDGKFGPLTKAAVQAFQRAHGLGDDGLAGLKTGVAIEAVLRPSVPVIAPKPKPVAALPSVAAVKGAPAANVHSPSLWVRLRFLFTGHAA